jgi:hypothetical protein
MGSLSPYKPLEPTPSTTAILTVHPGMKCLEILQRGFVFLLVAFAISVKIRQAEHLSIFSEGTIGSLIQDADLLGGVEAALNAHRPDPFRLTS